MPWHRFAWYQHLEDPALWNAFAWIFFIFSVTLYWLLRRKANWSVPRTVAHVSALLWAPAVCVFVVRLVSPVAAIACLLLPALFSLSRAFLKAGFGTAVAACIVADHILGCVANVHPIGRTAFTLLVASVWPAFFLLHMASLVLLWLAWGYLVYRLLYRFFPPFRLGCSHARTWCAGLMEMDAGAGGGVDREERRRIRGMVEEGLITASEACDLLDALARSGGARNGKDTMGFADFLAIGATGLVAVGFFLPWVDVNWEGAYKFFGGTVVAGALSTCSHKYDDVLLLHCQ